MTPEQIARLAHEVNRAYCQSLGDDSQPAWENAPDWQRQSAINGVQFHLAHPEASPAHSHEQWLAEKTATGWKYGPVKDPEKKEHPCFVPYDQLPAEQRAKDYLFRGVVRACSARNEPAKPKTPIRVETSLDPRTYVQVFQVQWSDGTIERLDDEDAKLRELMECYPAMFRRPYLIR
jgi:hypothetical protein